MKSISQFYKYLGCVFTARIIYIYIYILAHTRAHFDKHTHIYMSTYIHTDILTRVLACMCRIPHLSSNLSPQFYASTTLLYLFLKISYTYTYLHVFIHALCMSFHKTYIRICIHHMYKYINIYIRTCKNE